MPPIPPPHTHLLQFSPPRPPPCPPRSSRCYSTSPFCLCRLGAAGDCSSQGDSSSMDAWLVMPAAGHGAGGVTPTTHGGCNPPNSSPYPGWSPSLCLGHLPTQGCLAQTWSHVSPGWSPSPPQWPWWLSPTARRPLLPLLLVLLDVLGPGGAEASKVGFDIPQLQVLIQGRLPPLRAAGMGTAESKAEPPLPPPRSQNKWLSPTPKLNPTTSP